MDKIAPRGKELWLRLAMLVLSNAVLLYLAHSMPSNAFKVGVRDLVFAEIYSDREIRGLESIDTILKFKTDGSPALYSSYLDHNMLAQLKEARASRPGDDTHLARAIGTLVGRLPTERNCGGADGLKEAIDMVSVGDGCCSDYAKAYAAYAYALELPVRIVTNTVHGGVEYFDRSQSKWIWFDAQLTAQVESSEGRLLNEFEIRNASRWQELRLVDLPPQYPDAGFFNDRPNYNPRSFSYVMWFKGINFIQNDRYNNMLRLLHLSKEIRQIILLVSGIQPGYVLLTDEMSAQYLKMAKAAVVALVVAYLIANLLALAGILRGQSSLGRSG